MFLVFAHPSPFKKPVSEEKLRSLRENPIAIEFPWAPQETILTHLLRVGLFRMEDGIAPKKRSCIESLKLFGPLPPTKPTTQLLCRKFTRPLSSSSLKDLANLKSEQPKFTVDAVQKEIDDLLVKL
ncbi:hypothetical protein K435DRAFT_875154 [Dendrothele bispora CBS 962.96]|uniref:Uncharacterized protein n=1 Tax=Dendrothele bispora (strain CBS 962.96) TaxID=1314807 RepID=A0A4S8KUX3_DENBC|nr:hypothetical protein K435DRAFT_875154 [Dendrothele bispora CBS 962.96]